MKLLNCIQKLNLKNLLCQNAQKNVEWTPNAKSIFLTKCFKSTNSVYGGKYLTKKLDVRKGLPPKSKCETSMKWKKKEEEKLAKKKRPPMRKSQHCANWICDAADG